jgi:hypothetical protein
LTVAETPIPDDALVRYGFIRGTAESAAYCVGCGRIVKGLRPRAFKCRPCAVDQFRSVERATRDLR